MATTNHNVSCGNTNWLRQQHLLSAISSSFISCRPKATTNGEEEMSASIPFPHISHRTMATMTSYVQVHSVAQWRRLIISYRVAIQIGCGNIICYPPAPRASTTCRVKATTKNEVLRRTLGDDVSIALRHGNDL